MSDRLLGWLGIIALLLIFRGLRALFRRQSNAKDGMARITAAAERVLKEQKAAAQGQRGQNPGQQPKAARQPWQTGKTPGRQHAQNQPRAKAAHAPRPIAAPNTGAVTRRGGILSAGSEPVIQRRR